MPALEAAVADAKARGVEQFFCAGDIVGYGPFPDDVCEYLQQCNIRAITGNYDRKVLLVLSQGPSAVNPLQKKKQKVLLWTAAHIQEKSQKYLESLPERLELAFPGPNKVLVVHGSPIDNDEDIYPSITDIALKAKMGEARCDTLVCGHTHIPFVKRVGGVLVVNCGSTGQPVDGDTRVSYALIEFGDGNLAHAHIVRVQYEVAKVIDALRGTSLPKGLRKDFALGSKRIFLQ